MNIICNNCVGARIYQQSGEQFNNPFMWSLVSGDDFIYLINHFDKINFDRIRVRRVPKRDIFEIIVDDKVTLRFIHHHQNSKCIQPMKKGVDIFYNQMTSYLIGSYFRRVDRMKEKPIFVISDKISCEEGFTFNPDKIENIHNSLSSIVFCGCDNPKVEGIKFVKVGDLDTTSIAKEALKNIDFGKL